MGREDRNGRLSRLEDSQEARREEEAAAGQGEEGRKELKALLERRESNM